MISLSKEHAGGQVLVEIPKLDIWVILTATTISDNEKWKHTPVIKKDLSDALDWVKKYQLEQLIFLN